MSSKNRKSKRSSAKASSAGGKKLGKVKPKSHSRKPRTTVKAVKVVKKQPKNLILLNYQVSQKVLKTKS
jgi:hypothetical protein